MTKSERKKLIKAIDYFLDSNPDKWINGIDELFLLVYGEKWSKRLDGLKSIRVIDLMREMAGKE